MLTMLCIDPCASLLQSLTSVGSQSLMPGDEGVHLSSSNIGAFRSVYRV
jgi:hypothetical protein